jgi:type IV pilus assembly protein PilX
MNASSRRSPVSRNVQQRGVVLFVALIAMLVLSVAGIALVRSVDTSTSVAGNLAFRQASIGPVNLAIERAIDALFKTRSIVSQISDDTAHRYYASIQAGEKSNGVPALLAGPYATVNTAYAAAISAGAEVDLVSGMEVRAIIERVCNDAIMAAGGNVAITGCDTLPPKVSQAGTDNKYKPIPLPPIPNFRVSIRVDLPSTNTVTFAQAFVRQ